MKEVSVIIPMHNSSKHIKQCLESVINQTYNNLEIIVVDDASEDNSISVVNDLKQYYNLLENPISNNNTSSENVNKSLKLIKLPQNLGAAKARNKGIEEATGDYICFLDADDYWTLDKIEKQVKFMEENNYTFIYGNYEFLKPDGKTTIANVPTNLKYNQALKNTAIFTSTVMFNMNKLTKKDIYMPDIRKGQDTATWWQVLKKGITAYGMQEVLVTYRVGEGSSLSSNKTKALKRTWDLYKREEIGFLKKIYCFMCYIKNAIKRRI